MAKVLTDDQHYRDIARVLREQGPEPDRSFKPGEMADGMMAMANYRFSCGMEAGASGEDSHIAYEKGLADGKKAEYDRFWDEFQQNGQRTDYRFAFAGWKGVPELKYPITPTGTYGGQALFSNFNMATPVTQRPDLTQLCKKIDLSQLTNVNELFNNARATHITVDLSNCTQATNAFNCSNGGGMDVLTIKVTEKLTSAQNFFSYPGSSGAINFQTVQFTDDSEIAFSLTMQRLVSLSHDSICSVINALSPNTSGLSLSLAKETVAAAFGSTVKEIDKNAQWLALTATKTNWTISLV